MTLRTAAVLGLFFLSVTMAHAELRYIEVDSIQNIPLIRIKSLDDFESILNENHISIVFLQRGELFAIVGSTYFAFPIGDYKSIQDYRMGSAGGYRNGADFNAAKEQGIDSSALYYFYKQNSFRSLADCQDAYKNEFSSSSEYYAAKEKGFSKAADYKEYLDYTRRGFQTKEESLLAASKGFSTANDYSRAKEGGFETFKIFDQARKEGLPTYVAFSRYHELVDSVESVMKELSIDRQRAFVYVCLKKLPKGEVALSVLSKNLEEQFNSVYADCASVVNRFVYNDQLQNDRYGRSSYNTRYATSLFSVISLESFLGSVSIEKIGSYNAKTEIFKRNGKL